MSYHCIQHIDNQVFPRISAAGAWSSALHPAANVKNSWSFACTSAVCLHGATGKTLLF